ncbi:MAG TPA: sigma-70 family RNA polymerase sigma factor [Saprospiraceae bacterium]|nr:sigma-70 family RNA polymerase sigma factor [Saprospiraceae bacterium]MCB9269165.1 sigma-70 family RNA polymerase sigma factor [Lewinellaceae bacterium]HPG05410.1 sigma-70 family RNA polymerase sigma factor [Saprospiraceae bacterium]HPR00105.1 sigma-70 family RNA polymerase sigma factor [Saprospiraceae bacterium]HQU53329.1 sigma-70 family RNA polymerase sigma factor [Saprospiraceae bacterium]
MNVPHPLWLRFKQGDSDAFEQLYQENLDGLLRYGHHFTPQTELIEDVIQELFVDLWQRKANLGDTDSPRKYLCASLRHRLYRTLKKNAKTASEDEIPFDMSWDWEDAPSSEERYAQVESALEQLSHREKEAIYLRYHQGLSYEEIGDIMGVQYQSLRNQVHRAIQKLRTILTIVFMIFLTGMSTNMRPDTL